jgi:hypothetical protein
VGEYRTKNKNQNDDEEMPMYEVIALAKRLNFSFQELREISFVTLINILLSSVQNDEKEATQKDIDSFF